MNQTNETKNANEAQDDQAMEILDSLRIEKAHRRHAGGGAWVIGTMGGHHFEALVFPEHAESPDYELEDSRISKLHLQRLADRVEVACFDRGWDRKPTTPEAETIVGLLRDGLAEFIYEIEPQGRAFMLAAVQAPR